MEREPDLGLDLAAASLRADEAEVARAVEIFATKLENALPTSCRVARRRRRPLSRESRVAAVEVDLGDVTFTLQQTRHGIVAERMRRVHDMSRRTEKLQLADWLRSLEDVLRERAGSSLQARTALEKLLET
jgi:hypothetical protein